MHSVRSEAIDPTQASNAGFRRSGIINPSSAPPPQSAKLSPSSGPSEFIKVFNLPALLRSLEQQENNQHGQQR
jgi:hypothetical protein